VYTRCAGCHIVHAVNASLLAAGGGRYRCGKCNKVNNALEALFDEWPQAGAHPPQAGQTPVLGLALDLEAAAQSRQLPDDAAAGEPVPARQPYSRAHRPLVRASWIAGAIVLSILVAWQWAEFQGKPLLERSGVSSTLKRAGLQKPPTEQPFRDLEQVQLVSRELTSHPYAKGQLRLSATIVNRADREQPYPDIEIALLDASGQVVLKRRFTPADYLGPDRAPGSAMVPEAYLPLVLDMEDPGQRAVGFELEFR
jgi:predicted Zn finger-like uncharacterized protein